MPAEHKSAVDRLFQGKVAKKQTKKKAGQKKRPTEQLPNMVKDLSNLYAAARSVEKEMEVKLKYAENLVKTYCLKRFSELFAETSKRPSSIEFLADHSRFLFTQTTRTNLTFEKTDALKSMGVEIDDFTELKGLRIDYEAIKRHKLTDKLKDALEGMGLSKEVLDDCFIPNVELNENFYDRVDDLVKKSLHGREKLETKLYEVMTILSPSNQIRNLEIVGLNVDQAFQYVRKTEIEATDVGDVLKAA